MYGDTAEGPVSHFPGGLAAVLGRHDEADGLLAQSAAFNERAGAKFFAARTDLLWARTLAERRSPGDIDKARDLLTRAHAVAEANGYRKRRAARSDGSRTALPA